MGSFAAEATEDQAAGGVNLPPLKPKDGLNGAPGWTQLMPNGNIVVMENPETAPNDNPSLELSIETVFGILAFLAPYGAEQMNLPHNYWLGLGCWIIGCAIAIRVFWIFPVWNHRLSRLEKSLIAFIAIMVFLVALYRPVMSAYSKRNGAPASVHNTKAPATVPTVPKGLIATPPAVNQPKALTKPRSYGRQSTPVQPTMPVYAMPSQNCPNGVCIGGDNFGNPTVNNYAPPLPKIVWNQSAVSLLPNTSLPGIRPKLNGPKIEVLIQLQGTFMNPAFTFRCSVPCLPVNQLTLNEDGSSASNLGTSVTPYKAHGDPTAILLVYDSPSRMLAGTRLEVTFQSLNQQEVNILDVQPYTPQ